MGKNVVHCGPAGGGEVAKLCNNLALAISMVGTSEALALGERLGTEFSLHLSSFLSPTLFPSPALVLCQEYRITLINGFLLPPLLGMDPKILASIMNTSTARCWSSDTYNPYPGVTPASPANNGYAGGKSMTNLMIQYEFHLSLSTFMCLHPLLS